MTYTFDYLVDLYHKYQQGEIDPQSSMGQYFQQMDREDLQDLILGFSKRGQSGYNIGIGDAALSDAMILDGHPDIKKTSEKKKTTLSSVASNTTISQITIQVLKLIDVYRQYGIYKAAINPLNPENSLDFNVFDLNSYGLKSTDSFQADGLLGLHDTTVGKVVNRLESIYCGYIAFEFHHINRPDIVRWITNYLEDGRMNTPLSSHERMEILQKLIVTTASEKFLDLKHQAVKRFGADGMETLIPVLQEFVNLSNRNHYTHMVIGMAHRGRLSVLSHIVKKPLDIVLNEFEEFPVNHMGGENGDVKYHLGWRSLLKGESGNLYVEVLSNPSHLEGVDPVLMGYVKGLKDKENTKPIGIMVHGDGAVIGQGVVLESVNLSNIPGYGEYLGYVHIVMDNQVAYTTEGNHDKSADFPTGIFKGFNIPIVHVNVYDPDSAIKAVRFLFEFRKQFHQDVALNLIGFRLHGHNEGDEPTFTNPVMYHKISKLPSILDHYAQKLHKEGVLSDTGESMMNQQMQVLEDAFKDSKEHIKQHADDIAPLPYAHEQLKLHPTGVSDASLKSYGTLLYTLPQDFHLNPKLKRILKARQKMVETKEGIDWGMAENLAYASLLDQGISVRLSGEDSIRGTFSHRHSLLYDVETGIPYNPLKTLVKERCCLEFLSSAVSEYGVMGFDYGYSLVSKKTLTIWEAQFGDFSNPAQVIIDQFIASGESKWDVQSGLVLLLPHGQEGMGPEHSSARVGRYLQLCAQDNLKVGYVSTAANFFHYFRQHILEGNKKPLILMTPKSLLRLPASFASFHDLNESSYFHEIYDEVDPSIQPKSVLFCAGKVYYDLMHARTSKSVAIIRMEQLYPWPEKAIEGILNKYGKNVSYTWVQEEAKNDGAWFYVYPQFLESFKKVFKSQGFELRYVGRPPMASPAVGIHSLFKSQQEDIIQKAFRFKENING